MLLPEKLLARLSERIEGETGLYFPREQWEELERKLSHLCPDFGFDDLQVCGEWLVSVPLTPPRLETLVNHLAVGETYFFRGKGCCDALREAVLPQIIQAQRGGEQSIRLWSIGCSTGEEPYTLAMLLHSLLPDLHEWNIRIAASDINTRSLRKAARGVYPEWAFRAIPEEFKSEFFRKTREGFEVLPCIKNMVRFFTLNLVQDAYPSSTHDAQRMHIILCRNVLMYFSPDSRTRVIRHLHRSLSEGGWCIVSPTEASPSVFPQFTPVHFPGAIFFRKVPASPPQKAVSAASSPIPLPRSPERENRSTTAFPSARKPDTVEQPPAPGKLAESVEGTRDGKVYHLLSHTCAAQGDLTQALHWNEKAIAQDEFNAAFVYFRAVILQQQQLSDEAFIALRQTLYLNPEFVAAHVLMGKITRGQGKIQESNRHFERARKLLQGCDADEVLPEFDEMTAGELRAWLASLMRSR